MRQNAAYQEYPVQGTAAGRCGVPVWGDNSHNLYEILTQLTMEKSMGKTYLDDYLAKNPETKLIYGYPLDEQSDKPFVLCVKQAGYQVECIMGDHADCRDCWNSTIVEGVSQRKACNCRFGEQYNGPPGKTIIGCTEVNVWCNDCIASSCKMYAGKQCETLSGGSV